MWTLIGKRWRSGTPSFGLTTTPRQSVIRTKFLLFSSICTSISSSLASTMSERIPFNCSSKECSKCGIAANSSLSLLALRVVLYFSGIASVMFCRPIPGARKCSFKGKRSGEGTRALEPFRSSSTPVVSVATKKFNPSLLSVETPCWSSLTFRMPGHTSGNSISREICVPWCIPSKGDFVEFFELRRGRMLGCWLMERTLNGKRSWAINTTSLSMGSTSMPKVSVTRTQPPQSETAF
mmetsp:Transcript_31914/g.80951  ORF Transcript_31914/g.80951 Transcript_31914/m.80951 type:complete len:237 (+) Transcript_31914:390-1100(+)